MEQVLNFFISNAFAADAVAPATAQQSTMSLVMMVVIFFAFVYFAIWRPQNKRAKEQQALLTSLAKGDEIVTGGGLLGRITKVSDLYVVLALNNNVEVVLQKSSVVGVLPKGTLKAIE